MAVELPAQNAAATLPSAVGALTTRNSPGGNDATNAYWWTTPRNRGFVRAGPPTRVERPADTSCIYGAEDAGPAASSASVCSRRRRGLTDVTSRVAPACTPPVAPLPHGTSARAVSTKAASSRSKASSSLPPAGLATSRRAGSAPGDGDDPYAVAGAACDNSASNQIPPACERDGRTSSVGSACASPTRFAGGGPLRRRGHSAPRAIRHLGLRCRSRAESTNAWTAVM